MNGNLIFRIIGQGGFITVREWRLFVYDLRWKDGNLEAGNIIISGVRKWKLQDAKAWAEAFRGDGAQISAFSVAASY